MPETTLELSDTYKNMEGIGQIVIDEAGYPARIRLDLDLGKQETGEKITAVLDIHYNDFITAPTNPTAMT